MNNPLYHFGYLHLYGPPSWNNVQSDCEICPVRCMADHRKITIGPHPSIGKHGSGESMNIHHS